MWYEGPDMTWDLFNTNIDIKECSFCPSMWSERPDMTWDLFNINIDVKDC